jgi:dTDP-4-amino-4,6-dideoxygalactose transaminase
MTENLPAILGGAPIRPEGPPDWPPCDAAITEALARCAADGSWGKYHGPHCRRLVQSLSDYHDGSEAVLCSSGTAAIELALRGLAVGPGDEVILAAYDFKGNFLDVLTTGARPVLVDIEPRSCRIDAQRLEDAFSPATKAVIVSHLHGCVANMPAVMQIAAERNVAVIEDACQAPGSTVYGRTAGTWGDVGVLSFGGSKLLSAGRGGAVLTKNSQVMQRIRVYSFRGNDAYPLSELQACVLAPQLEQLDALNAVRALRIESLREVLPARSGLTLVDGASASCRPGHYKTGFHYEPAAFENLPRDRFLQALRAEGIAVDAGFRALHAVHSRGRFRAVGNLDNAEQADCGLIVLHHPILLYEECVDQFGAALDRIREHARMIADSSVSHTEPLSRGATEP